MSLKNKRILITAGPTWVPIDKVRVISNMATGQTGILLAEKLRRLGVKVTLLLGPVDTCCSRKSPSAISWGTMVWLPLAKAITLNDFRSGMGKCFILSCTISKKIKLIRFKFFDELRSIINRELRAKKYDAVIHSAAVSDYKPEITFKQKVKSGIKQWKLNLAPTPKIIELIKKIDKAIYLVGFKFEPKASRRILIDKARILMRRAKLDLAVANSINRNGYRAYVVGQEKIYGPLLNKSNLVNKLIQVLVSTGCKGNRAPA